MQKILLSVLLLALAVSAGAKEAEDALRFYQAQARLTSDNRRQDRAYAAALADALTVWQKRFAKEPQAKEALLLQADLFARATEYPQALSTLVKAHYLFPAANDSALLSTRVESVMNELDKTQKGQALKLLAADTASYKEQQKREAFLRALYSIKTPDLYAATVEEFENFLAEEPEYAQNDKLEILLGDLHRRNANPLAAAAQYKKVAALYPKTEFRAASLRMAADVYADDLKDTQTATAMYNEVLKRYPDSVEVGVVYKHLGIMEENNKHFDNAIAYYNKAIEHLAGQPAAYGAMQGKADVYAKMKDYQSAYTMLLQTAETFKADESKYVATMLKAANVADRRLKDRSQKSVTLEKILLAYPQNQRAPEIMFELGYCYEKQGKNPQAAAMYKKLIISNPTDAYAGKAQSRLDRLEK